MHACRIHHSRDAPAGLPLCACASLTEALVCMHAKRVTAGQLMLTEATGVSLDTYGYVNKHKLLAEQLARGA